MYKNVATMPRVLSAIEKASRYFHSTPSFPHPSVLKGVVYIIFLYNFIVWETYCGDSWTAVNAEGSPEEKDVDEVTFSPAVKQVQL